MGYQWGKEAEMAERIFLDEGGVKVTQARFMVPGQTYAMSGVTSVAAHKENPSKRWPILLIVLGGLAAMIGLGQTEIVTIIVGIVVLAVGILWLRALRPTYHVLLRSASGEARALSSKDREWVERVVKALNDAIVVRG